ncbi:MAG: ACT domain-containing protein [Thermoplasmata archaeon]
MKQFSIQVRDRVGELARVTEIMANHGINIIAISSEGGGSKRPVIRIVTEDQASTRKALERAGREFTEEEILVVKLLDRPGELAKIARRLARKAINVNSIYIFGKSDGKTEIALAVDKLDEAREVLGVR